jgi:glycosyltransferase involved in cell wall biosynthesis
VESHRAEGALPPGPSVSVVIPALNEALNLPHVLSRLPGGLHQVILVDGNSVDGTCEVARQCRPDIHIVRQTRTGKGNALACGFAHATGEIIVMLDADGSTDPGEIEKFVRALDGADYAKGTRFSAGGYSHDISRLRKWGNSWLNRLVNRFFDTNYTDLCYGYNAFRRHLVPALDLPPLVVPDHDPQVMLWGDGFEIETLINIRVAMLGVRTVEVGSIEQERLHGASNLNAVSDGVRVLRMAAREHRQARGDVPGPAAARPNARVVTGD